VVLPREADQLATLQPDSPTTLDGEDCYQRIFRNLRRNSRKSPRRDIRLMLDGRDHLLFSSHWQTLPRTGFGGFP
jgi:hypothetical protein